MEIFNNKRFNPARYYNNMNELAGRIWRFTGYSRQREPYYGCYWSAECRNGAGWHGFVTLPSGASDERQLCTRHWRVAMGYSAA